jgi:hypothetical protein
MCKVGVLNRAVEMPNLQQRKFENAKTTAAYIQHQEQNKYLHQYQLSR